METRTEVIERDGFNPEAITVVRHMSDKEAAKLHQFLDAASASFHESRGDALPEHGAKFDQGIAMARSAVDELARDHTLPKKEG